MQLCSRPQADLSVIGFAEYRVLSRLSRSRILAVLFDWLNWVMVAPLGSS